MDDGYRAMPRKFLGIVGQDPSDSKSSWLHVDIIFRFCFHSFEVYSSIDSSKLIGVLPEPWYRVCYQVLLCS